MYRFARYSQDGTDHISHFWKCSASRKGGPAACQVMIREGIAAAALIPQDDLKH